MPEPAPLTQLEYTGIVERVKATLIARGVPLAGPCGAFRITAHVVWLLAHVRGESIGLVHKSASQNGCTVGTERYGVDVAMYPDGQIFDMLINAETENRPAWNPSGSGFTDPELWRPPFDPGDDLEPPAPPTPTPPPSPLPVPSTRPVYPGDDVGRAIGAILLSDYRQIYTDLQISRDAGMGIWFWRCAWDIALGESIDSAIARHRDEWRAILGLPRS